MHSFSRSYVGRTAAILSLASGLIGVAGAQAPTPTNTLVNGQKADATKVMANFQQALNLIYDLQNVVNPLSGALSVDANSNLSSLGNITCGKELLIRNNSPVGADPNIVMVVDGFNNYLHIGSYPGTGSQTPAGIRFATGTQEMQPLNRMTIEPDGKVGIGTTSPLAQLDVAGGVLARGGAPGASGASNNGYAFFGNGGDNDSGLFSVADGRVGVYTNNILAIDVMDSGGVTHVGVGAGATGGSTLHVGAPSTATTTTGVAHYFQFDSASLVSNPPGGISGNRSITCDADVLTQGRFIAASDARFKHVEGRSDAGRDLSTLMGIQIVDYSFVDTVAKGNEHQKKVVAQQVESVFPQAVSAAKGIVPDIYKAASYRDGWVKSEVDLKIGERVRLMDEKKDGVFEVLEVRQGGFRTSFVPSGDRVFVYGREVDDCRAVDYEALSMLNLSATQEIVRRLMVQEAENEALRAKVAQLESLAAEVAELKAALQPLKAK